MKLGTKVFKEAGLYAGFLKGGVSLITFTQRKCGKCGNPQEFGTRPKSAQGLKLFEFKCESSKSDDEVSTTNVSQFDSV